MGTLTCLFQVEHFWNFWNAHAPKRGNRISWVNKAQQSKGAAGKPREQNLWLKFKTFKTGWRPCIGDRWKRSTSTCHLPRSPLVQYGPRSSSTELLPALFRAAHQAGSPDGPGDEQAGGRPQVQSLLKPLRGSCNGCQVSGCLCRTWLVSCRMVDLKREREMERITTWHWLHYSIPGVSTTSAPSASAAIWTTSSSAQSAFGTCTKPTWGPIGHSRRWWPSWPRGSSQASGRAWKRVEGGSSNREVRVTGGR